MPVSRRDFLRFLAGGGLIAISAYLFKEIFRPARLSDSEERTLDSLVDTLIPEDETPGAIQLGVAEMMKSKAAADNRYRFLIKKGCTWLDKMARGLNVRDFTSLKTDDRDAIIGNALNSEPDSVQRICLYRMRADAFYYYYGHRKSWTQIGYKGPPQPYGFPDYYAAPCNDELKAV